MSLAQSKITAQGQVSIPVSVMRKFGLAPGGVITWESFDGRLVIEKAGQYSLADVRKALKISRGVPKTDDELREGIKARIRNKHASR